MKKKNFLKALYILAAAALCFVRHSSGLADDYLEYVKKNFSSRTDSILKDPQNNFIVICPDAKLGEKILERELVLFKRFHKTFKTLTFWDDPVIVKIFPDRKSYAEEFQSYTSLAFMAKFKKDGRTHRLIASWMQDDLVDELIPHETAHVFIADLARIDEINSTQMKNKRVLPRWIDEGLAQYFEGDSRLSLFKLYVMRLAFKEGGIMPLADFFGLTDYPENTYYFYIQSEVLTHFLLSQPNGYQKIRNYITIFRSKVKDGTKAFTLSFREYNQLEDLEKDFLRWGSLQMKKNKPDMESMNSKIARQYKIREHNENLYKEVALGMVAYQMLLNENYPKSIKLATAALKQKNGFSLAYDAQILSLMKTDKAKTAENLLSLYQQTDPKNAYRLLADIRHKEFKYREEITFLEKLLALSPESGYLTCMRIAFIYSEFLRDYQMGNFYATKAKEYPHFTDDVH